MALSRTLTALACFAVCAAAPVSAETYSGRLKLVENPLTWVVLESKGEEYKVRPSSAKFSALRELALENAKVTVVGTVSGAYLNVKSFAKKAPKLSGTLELVTKPLTQVVFVTQHARHTIRPSSSHFSALRKLALANTRVEIVGVASGSYLDVESYTVSRVKLVGVLELVEEPLTQVIFVADGTRYTVRPSTPLFGTLRGLAREGSRVGIVGVPAGDYMDVKRVQVLGPATPDETTPETGGVVESLDQN